LKAWAPLLLLQALVAGIVLFPFLDGSTYFAFLDIGSDTYVTSGGLMHSARMLARGGLTAWSFDLGLGAPATLMYNEPFGLLSILAGADHVLALRIWVYLLKIALGGAFFFMLARGLTRNKEAALITALAYSFCGYIVVNGQWDSETNVFVFAPLVLWGIQRHLRTGDLVAFPVALSLLLLSGVFFVLAGVSLVLAGALCVAAAESPRAMARTWLTRLLPLSLVGFLIAAPYILPAALQLLDSPRVAGAQTLPVKLLSAVLSVSNPRLLLEQVGGLFHKDIFGIGGFHNSYMNYLESPGFYVGMLPLVVLPQLWKGSRRDRRVLVVGLLAVALFMVFPVFRLAAFGFAVPYFRATTLWVTLGLLVMGVRALDRVLNDGADRKLLALGASTTLALLGLVLWLAPASPTHAVKMGVFVLLWTTLIGAVGTRPAWLAKLPSFVLALMLIELVTTAWPSYFIMRTHASPELQPQRDETLVALAAVRADHPPPFYRVEKTFHSYSFAEALAQDYHGVKSYYYHGRSIVQFYQSMDLFSDSPKRAVNYTNWLPPPDSRFVLQSVLGVRYIISKSKLDWPGLEPLSGVSGVFAYRNELALPLGVVHTRQVTAADMAALSRLPLEKARWVKDLALLNAVVVEHAMPRWGRPFDLAGLAAKTELDAPRDYAQPALRLQRTGLQVSHFSDSHITGTIAPEEAGILVFSIPAYRGWSLRVDGRPVDLATFDFGLLGAPVEAGRHEIDLRYRLPGLRLGMAAGILGLVLLALPALLAGRRRRLQASRHSASESAHTSAGGKSHLDGL
jgi:uncharacterized membrane protein YfhO